MSLECRSTSAACQLIDATPRPEGRVTVTADATRKMLRAASSSIACARSRSAETRRRSVRSWTTSSLAGPCRRLVTAPHRQQIGPLTNPSPSDAVIASAAHRNSGQVLRHLLVPVCMHVLVPLRHVLEPEEVVRGRQDIAPRPVHHDDALAPADRDGSHPRRDDEPHAVRTALRSAVAVVNLPHVDRRESRELNTSRDLASQCSFHAMFSGCRRVDWARSLRLQGIGHDLVDDHSVGLAQRAAPRSARSSRPQVDCPDAYE